jgi:uncharacterized integral membrane protein (TIGR00698 family)
LAPGILLAAAATGAIMAGARLAPTVSPLVLAIVLGALVGTAAGSWTRRRPAAGPRWAVLAPGTGLVAKRVLRTGVVLLGLQLSVPDVLHLGWRGLTVVVVTLAVTFGSAQLVGRRLGVSREAALLVGTGFAVCGAAAVSAMSSVVERTPSGAARDDRGARDDVAAALALVTIFGTLAILVLPPLSRWLGLSDAQAGLWIGASVQEVAQVVAAAGAVSAAALAIGTVAKLARVVLLAPLVAATGAVLAGRSGARGAANRPAPVPLFVVGFLVAVAVRSFRLLPAPVLGAAHQTTTVLFVAAMFALGLGVDVPRLLRTGRRTLALGAVTGAVGTLVALAGVLLLG